MYVFITIMNIDTQTYHMDPQVLPNRLSLDRPGTGKSSQTSKVRIPGSNRQGFCSGGGDSV